MRVKTKLFLVNGIILSIVLLVSVISILGIRSLVEDSQWVTHSYEVIGLANIIQGHVIDQESGARGFLATGDEEFLEPYYESQNSLNDSLKKAEVLVADNPEAVARFAEIRRIADAWERNYLSKYIEMRRDVNAGMQHHQALLDIFANDQGKKRMDAFRKKWSEVLDNATTFNAKEICWALLIDMTNMETGERGFLLTGEEEYLEPFEQSVLEFERRFAALKKANVPGAEELEFLAFDWVNGVGRVAIGLKKEAIKHSEMSDLSKLLGSKQGKALVDNIKELTKSIIDAEEMLLIQREERAQAMTRQASLTNVLGAFLVAIIVFSVALLVQRNITKPLTEGMIFAKAIADGDLDATVEIEQNDELGDLATALNRMAKRLRNINWLQQGKEKLDDELRGEHDVNEFIKRFITYFTKRMGAQIGALYIREGEMLTLKASHAFSDRQGNFNSYKLGEGMVGQAALENETILFTDLEGDDPRINYGAGEALPSNYMMVPISFENDVIGVMLLGSIERFSELQRLFVEQNIENVAVLFNAARSRETIQELLVSAQENQKQLEKANIDLKEQAEALQESEMELQAQQEELRVTNEELEEQTRALKKSESELQAQQEELRVTNEELEEQAKALKQQKDAIRKKNEDILQAQSAIEQKAKDLELASKYKSEFLANMSHELRTPLNSILILSQLFEENKSKNLTEKQIESARAIYSSGSDLLNLINEILDLSKVESGKIELILEDVKLKDVVDNTRSLFQNMADDKGLDFTIELAENLPKTVLSDSQRLQQILRNLLSNAFKFTSEGQVALRIARPEAEHTPEWLETEEAISFSVIDQGVGIPDEQKLLIFEAFKQADGTTSRNYGGTGLGLSISKELAKLLGGAIYLESTQGEGSMFTVTLPEKQSVPRQEGSTADLTSPERIEPGVKVSTANNSSVAKNSASAKAECAEVIQTETMVEDDRNILSPEDKSVLIIEDDAKFARIIRDFARERDFKCIVAENGETGLHFADYYKPSAIILDIGLPGIDGWTVMERLKDNPDLRHIPVHFMSASDSSLEAMRMGAVGFLTKPVSIEMVESAFSRIEGIISKPVSKLLVVEDNKVQRDSILQLISGSDVETTAVATGNDALAELEKSVYDCVILDLGLPDMSGFTFLEKVSLSETIARVPIIIYTAQDLTREEEQKLNQYAESIIIKGAKSPERLLDESALFLHRVENELPEKQQKMLRMVHDKEALLAEKKVLLVDDDMRNVFALTHVLEEKSMNVVVARNGLEALDKLKENPDVNIVLMDIMMPQMDGYDAMREIRKNRAHDKLPIIALTAKAMKGDRGKCIEAGASDYLAKPVNTDKLLSMMRVWLY